MLIGLDAAAAQCDLVLSSELLSDLKLVLIFIFLARNSTPARMDATELLAAASRRLSSSGPSLGQLKGGPWRRESQRWSALNPPPDSPTRAAVDSPHSAADSPAWPGCVLACLLAAGAAGQ
ncbi:hypothetical protein CCMA1212_000731 [Trichoderma ghanense]|uniref:Uncharacterized protein n=1 Tax=Trichoderma ghanense TaxID=65468 RepID=A0ABY2HGP8_9HYPO